jgi:hypothetical protein
LNILLLPVVVVEAVVVLRIFRRTQVVAPTAVVAEAVLVAHLLVMLR